MADLDLPELTDADSAPSSAAARLPSSDLSIIIQELLKQKIDIGYSLVSRYLTAFAIYSAIIATILKFALDVNATIELRKILLYLSLGVTGLGFACPFLGELLRRQIENDVKIYHGELGLQISPEKFMVLRYIAIVSVVFLVITTSGIFYVLTVPSPLSEAVPSSQNSQIMTSGTSVKPK